MNVAPANGFAAPVTFTVSGLPSGATFQFSPASVTPAAGATASTTLTITAGTNTPAPNPYIASGHHGAPGNTLLAAGAIIPIGLLSLLPAARRRKLFKSLFLGGGALPLLIFMIALAGCGGGSKSVSTTPSPTPTGNSTVTITATSGALSHTTTLSLTIK